MLIIQIVIALIIVFILIKVGGKINRFPEENPGAFLIIMILIMVGIAINL